MPLSNYEGMSFLILVRTNIKLYYFGIVNALQFNSVALFPKLYCVYHTLDLAVMQN